MLSFAHVLVDVDELDKKGGVFKADDDVQAKRHDSPLLHTTRPLSTAE